MIRYWIIPIVIGLNLLCFEKGHADAVLRVSVGMNYSTGFDDLNRAISEETVAMKKNPSNRNATISPAGPIHFGFQIQADITFDLGPKVFWTHFFSAWANLSSTTSTIEKNYLIGTDSFNFNHSLLIAGIDATTVIPLSSIFSFRWGIGFAGGR